MSVNVKTSTGLKKISGENITSTKVLSAIGYVPAQAAALESHASNDKIHITTKERNAWDAKSNFNGDYNSLTNKPNILENNSDTFQIVGVSGNIAFQVDEEATHVGVLTVGGKRFDTTINDLKVSIAGNKTAIENNNKNIEFLDTRLDILEPIVEKHATIFTDDNTGVLKIVDNQGNIALKIDETATHIDNLQVNKIKIGERNISSELTNLSVALDAEIKRSIEADERLTKEDERLNGLIDVNIENIEGNEKILTEHINDEVRHITAQERETWDTTTSKTTSLEILTSNIRKQSDEEDDAFYIVDIYDNIGFKVSEDGAYVANKLFVNNEDIVNKISNVESNSKLYVENKINNLNESLSILTNDTANRFSIIENSISTNDAAIDVLKATDESHLESIDALNTNISILQTEIQNKMNKEELEWVNYIADTSVTLAVPTSSFKISLDNNQIALIQGNNSATFNNNTFNANNLSATSSIALGGLAFIDEGNAGFSIM